MFDIRFIGENSCDETKYDEPAYLVAPGDIVSPVLGFMRGHGTYTEDGNIYASVAGTVEKVNKLYSVKPRKTRYNGEVGDVVIGRIIEVQQKRWSVDINARLDAVLLLSSVNLPGGELRRKTEEDENKMRNYLDTGDLISAEVQSVFSDGSLSLHTRSLKYGKLSQGTLIKVSPSIVQRKKTHFHNLLSGVQIILSNNGNIWISPACGEDGETGGFAQNLECIPKVDRETISRLRNCIQALAHHNQMLSDTVILYAYEASLNLHAKEILKPESMKEITEAVVQRIEVEGI